MNEQELDEWFDAQKMRYAGNASAIIELERTVNEERQRIFDETNESIAKKWSDLWGSLKRSVLSNILEGIERRMQKIVQDFIEGILAGDRLQGPGLLQSGLNIFSKLVNLGTRFAAGAATGNIAPVPANLIPTNGGFIQQGGPLEGLKVLGKPAINVNVNMAGAMVMMDNPAQMDSVVRSTLKPAFERVAQEGGPI